MNWKSTTQLLYHAAILRPRPSLTKVGLFNISPWNLSFRSTSDFFVDVRNEWICVYTYRTKMGNCTKCTEWQNILKTIFGNCMRLVSYRTLNRHIFSICQTLIIYHYPFNALAIYRLKPSANTCNLNQDQTRRPTLGLIRIQVPWHYCMTKVPQEIEQNRSIFYETIIKAYDTL